MPYKLRKLPLQDSYKVYNAKTGVVHAKKATLANAKKQLTLLNMAEHGMLMPRKK